MYDKYANQYIDSLGSPNLLNKRLTWNQKVQKDHQWFKDCIDFIDGQYDCYKDSKNIARIQMNYNLANGRGESEMREYGKFMLPSDLMEEGFTDMDIYGNIQHHPIIQQVYNAMVGEQQLRPLTPMALDVSGFSLSQKKRQRLELSQQYLHEKVIAPKLAQIKSQIEAQYSQQHGISDPFKLSPQDQQQMQADIEQRLQFETPKEIHDYMRKDYKSQSSIQAQKILDFVMSDLKVKFITDENFKNLIIAGEEIYHVGVRNGRSFIDIVNPMGFHYIARPNSMFIEDGVAWKYEQYIMYNDLYAWHGAEIGNSKILKDKLEAFDTTGRRKHGEPHPQWVVEVQRGNTQVVDNAPNLNTREGQEYVQKVLGGSMATANRRPGDIRYVHCAWKGLRKIKQIKRYNADKDLIKSIWIDESYTFNPLKVDENGYRDIEEYIAWAPELNAGAIVDKDIYLDLGQVPYQYKSLDNPWDIKGPYVGGQYSKLMDNTSKTAPIDPAKPWQYKFNLQMAKIHEMEAGDLGKILSMVTSMMPEGWNVKKYLTMMKYGKIALNDPTREGYVPGMENMIKQLDLSTIDKIASYVQYLDYIRNQLILSMNYNPSRLGLQGPTVPVTNNQQNIIQSSYQTNDIFHFHNRIVENLLNVAVDVTKYALKDNDSIKGFVLDDLSIAELDLNWELLDNSEINIKIVNSSEEYQNIQEIKQLLQPFVQNQMLSMSDAIKIGFSKSKAEIMNIAESAQEASEKRAQQNQEMQKELMARQEQLTMQMEKMKQDFELEKQRRDHMADYREALVESTRFAQQKDIDQNKINDDLTLELIKQEYDKDKFDKEMKFKERQQDHEKEMMNKEFQLEREIANKKLELEKIKARNKPKSSSK